MKKVEELIEAFINDWEVKRIMNFFSDVYPLIELYKVEADNDWLDEHVSLEDKTNVRIIRTVYLLSKFCENHAQLISLMNVKYKKLWRKMEEQDG